MLSAFWFWVKRYFNKRRLTRWLKRTAVALATLFGVFFILNAFFPLPDKVAYSTVITDNKGEIIHAFLTPDQKWRMKTELHEISPLLRKTIIAKEDKYFYYHPGVNPLAVLRALANNVLRLKRTSGASTITMQVARALEPGKRTLWTKLREAFRAFQLEWKYNKKEILQMYLNLVPYGGNIEGVKAAAYLYFRKNPDHLSLAEITSLSIIPNRPSSLVIGRHNDRIVLERNRWLRRFASSGVFTEKEIQDALAEPLMAVRGSMPQYVPHLAGKLKAETSSLLIRSHVDLNTQLKTEKIVADYVRGLALRNIRNAAVMVIDNRTRRVIAYVGSANFRDTLDGGQVNGAAAVRQPGSTLKPLLYGICFDEGLLTPKTVITDVAVSYEGFAPENYDKKYNGYVTVEYALEQSLNIPAIKSLRQLGTDRLIAKLSVCRFRQIQKDRGKLGLSMVLGGCGTTLEELTGLFTVFAHEGYFTPPSFKAGDPAPETVNILSSGACYMVNEILSKVNRPDFPLNWTATEKMPKIAWKTGTSYGRRDAWSIGYNRNYTIGVWVGNFSGVGAPELSGAETATPLLFRIFNSIDYDANAGWFNQPADCDIRKVCSETGLLPSAQCDNLVMDNFIPLISSTTACNNRQQLLVDERESLSYCETCRPENGYKKKWFRILEPEMQAWFEERSLPFARVPSHNPDCEKIFRGNAPVISSPSNGSEYLMDKKNPEPLELVARTAPDVARVYWYIDNRYYKSAPAGDKQYFLPKEGPVKISCTDDKGRNRDIRITVRYVNL